MRSLFRNPYKKAGFNWWTIKKLKHLPPGKHRSLPFFGKAIHFISPTEFLHGLHEIFIDEIYKQELPADAYILDCGANIGLSVIYLKQQFPQATIVAFEPDETNFRLLEENTRSFGLTGITLKKEAVWIANTSLQFAGAGSMSSRIADKVESETVSVSATRLRDYLNRPVDFLKVDIEGAEYEVLKDIRENLHQVRNLFIEYHGSFSQSNELTEMLQWVSVNGFSVYIKEAAPVYPTPFYRNRRADYAYDVQLNIFCFRPAKS